MAGEEQDRNVPELVEFYRAPDDWGLVVIDGAVCGVLPVEENGEPIMFTDEVRDDLRQHGFSMTCETWIVQVP